MERVDGHDRLARFDVIAGADGDVGEAPVDLGLHGGRAAGFDGGHVFAALRYGGQGNGHGLHGHGAHSGGGGRWRRGFLAAADGQSQNNTSDCNQAFQNVTLAC